MFKIILIRKRNVENIVLHALHAEKLNENKEIIKT